MARYDSERGVVRIGLFPGQEEALRNELNRLHMLGRRRFLYLAIGLVTGSTVGLVLGKQLPTAKERVLPEGADEELAYVIEAARGPMETLRSNAVVLIVKFNDYPDHLELQAGLLRLAECLVKESPSDERRVLAMLVLQSLERAPVLTAVREGRLFADLKRVAHFR